MAEIRCPKCGRTMKEDNFYLYRNGERTELCKKCMTMHIDNFNPETFLWLLEKMDVPYIPEEWNVLRDKAYAKDPNKMNGMSVFGKYLSKMKLKQWSKYTWADTEQLRKESEERERLYYEQNPEMKELEEKLQQQYDRGEIPEAEYKTLMSTYAQNAAAGIYGAPQTSGPASSSGSMGNPFEGNFMAQEELNIGIDLTQEDKLYLATKWGRAYQPHEWVELEKNYNEMMDGFDIQDPDTINTLKHICKINLKMNQAIDCGDIDGYQKLSRVYDSLRKSAKFTAAQNKETKEDFVDCVGTMVAYCEKMGGQIPRYEIETPLDIVDKVIEDMKEYNRSLVYEDKALAQQIEQYLKKKENDTNAKKDKQEAKEKGLSYVELTDEDLKLHKEMLEQEKAADNDTFFYEKENF